MTTQVIGRINRGRTAITRKCHSVPYRNLLLNGLISPDMSIIDYGCGKGYDWMNLVKAGYEVQGYDKFIPEFTNEKLLINAGYDVAINNYVMNVIEDAEERQTLLDDMKHLANKLFITVRADKKSVGKNWISYSDGWLTTANTFQKFYDLKEVLKEFNNDKKWIFKLLTNNSNEIQFQLEKFVSLGGC